MKPKITLLCLASRLHGEEFIKSICGNVYNVFRKYSWVKIIDKPASSLDEVILGEKPDVLILVHATGGTSSLAFRIAEKYTDSYIVLLAHDKHNSLASALSARMKIGYEKVKLVYFKDTKDLEMKAERLIKAIYAAYKLKGLKILVINEKGVLGEESKKFMEKTGAVLEAISFEELWKKGLETSSREVEDVRKKIAGYIDLSGTRSDELEKIIRIYTGMHRLVEENNYNGIIIDCFPLVVKYRVTPCIPVAVLNSEGIPVACEEDYHSFLMLYLSLELTGSPGWISNPSGIVNDEYLRFAHCTIAPTLGKPCWLTTHFETGNPYAVICRYKYRKVLFGRYSRDYGELIVYHGEVIESGNLGPHYCRTQLIVKPLKIQPVEFIREAWGNHHVFIPYIDGIEEMLEYYSWIQKIRLYNR